MRWNVEGADGRTGLERIVQVEAATQAEAEQAARRQGLLVSAVYASTTRTPADALDQMVGTAAKDDSAASDTPAAPLDYAGPMSLRAVAVVGALPNYDGILQGARLLRKFARSYVVMAYLAFAAAAGVIGLGILAVLQSSLRGANALVPSILLGAGLAVTGIVLLNRATLLRLQADVAIATRDMARNSFRSQPGQPPEGELETEATSP